jgi:hypothetical protein
MSSFAPASKPAYVPKTGLKASQQRVVEAEPVVEVEDTACPVGFAQTLFPQTDGVTVGTAFQRKSSPITKFEESFILGPRHA